MGNGSPVFTAVLNRRAITGIGKDKTIHLSIALWSWILAKPSNLNSLETNSNLINSWANTKATERQEALHLENIHHRAKPFQAASFLSFAVVALWSKTEKKAESRQIVV